MASTAGKWWKRAAAAMKDKRSIYLCRAAGSGQRAEIEAAVIRATSHDERSVDYKNAARVFAWARTSPACLPLLMRSLARRAARTRSWAVAIKILLLAHGILLCSKAAKPLGRLPFDLSDFRDRSTHPFSTSYGFSAFVRAYFQFLDHRSVLSSEKDDSSSTKRENPAPSYSQLDMLVKMQDLLELLMQIRPYANGMEVGLILEAMDCAIIEIVEVYSSICSGIAHFLVDVLGPNSSSSSSLSLAAAAAFKDTTGLSAEERKRVGMAGMRILRRASEQSKQLSSYFKLCRVLGVLNAVQIPPVEAIPEEDIRDLEALVHGGVPWISRGENYQKAGKEEKSGDEPLQRRSETVVTEEWEIFEDGKAISPANSNVNPFFCLEDEARPVATCPPLPTTVCHSFPAGRNLIELI